MVKYLFLLVFLFLGHTMSVSAQDFKILTADRVFDGEKMQSNWIIIVRDEKIIYAGTSTDAKIPREATQYDFGDATLLPGLIEGHSHILLHPYNETSWNDQVLVESESERVVRATVHAKATLMAGFTTIRDLGSEGAGYADVGIKKSIEKGIIPGPRMIVAGKAIVAEGSYGPKGFHELVIGYLGAEVAGGHDNIIKVVRDQIGKGADVIKVYADYRWGPFGQAMPTFTQDELNLIVEVANTSGRQVVAHAATEEGMRRATLAGVSTIEHGDGATPEVLRLMKEKGVALCPTLAAGDAIMQYRGWNKGEDPDPDRIIQKKAAFKNVISSGVTIVMGGDVGVYTHGDNAREMEMMVEYGMTPLQTLQASTSINADIFEMGDQIGRINAGLLADIIVVKGNPLESIEDIRKVVFVMKNGEVFKKDDLSPKSNNGSLKIKLNGVFVNNQKEALKFYTEVLGFEKKMDIPLGEFSWLTVVSPADPNGSELLLEPCSNEAARVFQKAMYDQGIAGAAFEVDDINAEYERLVKLKVAFTMSPTDVGTAFIALLDDTCGNLIQIYQVK